MANTENITKIRRYAYAIKKIKDNYFNALTTANATMADQLRQTRNVDKTLIKTIYQPATDLQDDLMREYANISDNLNRDQTTAIMLTHKNAIASVKESFDTMGPKIMNRDSVTLYNAQYLQIFCKVLGIVIIIAIFFKYFSSITGMPSVSSIIPQSLPQSLSQPLAST